jgi:hypothetical protein
MNFQPHTSSAIVPNTKNHVLLNSAYCLRTSAYDPETPWLYFTSIIFRTALNEPLCTR